MIVTVTFNPALDYFVTLDELKISGTNRTQYEKLIAGGKGINVSLMLSHLSVPSTALGFTAGFTGQELIRQLQQEKISTDFIHCRNGMTRINVKIHAEQETEINGQGPQISDEELQMLKYKIEKLGPEDILILSGNVPSSVPYPFVHELLEAAASRHVSLIVDCDGPLLEDCLAYHPFLIKPNELELSHLIHDPELPLERAIERLRAIGAENILLSQGERGSLYFSKNGKVYHQKPVQGRLVSSVGAGDSMVAGFVAGLMEGLDEMECHRLAAACGSATAFSEGIADLTMVQNLLPQIEILEENELKN